MINALSILKPELTMSPYKLTYEIPPTCISYNFIEFITFTRKHGYDDQRGMNEPNGFSPYNFTNVR